MSSDVVTQSVQEKVSLTLFGVMGALALLSYLTLQQFVAPAFDELELDQARTNLVRARRAIQNDLRHLSAIAGDWALWDDAYHYVSGSYPAFEASNLNRPTLANLGLNLLAVYDADANPVWSQLVVDGQEQPIEALRVLAGDSASARRLVHHDDGTGEVSGLLRSGLGPMLFSSWSVLRSDGSGPVVGTLIMGQFLDKERAADLRRRTEVDLDWRTIGPVGEVRERSPGGADLPDRHEITADSVHSSAVLVDLFGEPLLLLDVDTKRSISALGRNTVDGALILLGLTAVIVALATWLLLRRIIVLPLAGLANHIVSIRKSGDLTKRFDWQRNDEIGALAYEFGRLTDELHDARRLLLDQSFKAGRADTAAEVMHNIRNAMTPMINGIDRLSRNFGVTDKLRVEQVVGELREQGCEPARAQKLYQYLVSAFAHIETSNADAADNLDVIARQARQVEAIIKDQERHARVAPVIEKLDLDEVLHEAVLVLPKAGKSAIDLQLARDAGAVRVHAHRVSLLQVIGNVLLNAYESIQRADAQQGSIDVSVHSATIDEKPMVRLTVRDSGCGFDSATGEKIFQRGFSSKPGNLSGLGLHWCANALAAMGGRIMAESRGPGHGAEIHVLLPAAPGG